MSEVSPDQAVSRRHFIRNLTIAAVAAAAAGSGAAVLTSKQQTATMPVNISEVPTLPTSIPAVQSAQTVANVHNDAAEILARLAQAQAENIRLQSALDAANREVESLRPALSNGTANNDALSNQMIEYRNQLSQSQEKVGVLSGLIALYEQLDQVDVTGTVQNGLTAVSESITELMDQTPTLSEGIQIGQTALANVENHIPLLENGRLWLDAQSNKLGTFYTAVEDILQNVMETVGTFLEVVEDWFQGVRKWLPFGIGEKATQVINAITTLVAETPHTVSGLNTYLAQPLDVWLVRENDEPRLNHTLIKPIREKLMLEADEAINRAQRVQTTYEADLNLPVQGKVTSHNAIRGQIANYRQQYQI